MRIPGSWSAQSLTTGSQSPPDLMFLRERVGGGELGGRGCWGGVVSNRAKKGVELHCEFEAAFGGQGAPAFGVDECLDPSLHLEGVIVVEEALYPPPASHLGLFGGLSLSLKAEFQVVI